MFIWSLLDWKAIQTTEHTNNVDEHQHYICGIIWCYFLLVVFGKWDFTLGMFSIFKLCLLWTLMQLRDWMNEHSFYNLVWWKRRNVDAKCSRDRMVLHLQWLFMFVEVLANFMGFTIKCHCTSDTNAFVTLYIVTRKISKDDLKNL